MLNPKEFALWLEECEARHDGYIMCAIGQNPKALREWYYSGQYSGKQLTKAYYWRENAQRVFDCQGMADGYVTEFAGLGTVNVRARNNYASWCGDKGEGTIPADKRTEGAAVFIYSKSAGYITHVGFLVRPVDENNRAGDWWVVEARGVMYGVVKTKLSERPWNRWGWMTKYFEYSDELPEATEVTYGARTLKRGMTGEDVKALQSDLIALGYSCGSYGADGEFGRATESAVKAFQLANGLEVDGIAGTMTFDALRTRMPETGETVDTAEPDKTVEIVNGQTWNVRTVPSVQGSRVLGIARRGDVYAVGLAEAEGWVNIIYNDESAWVSAKAVTV